MPWPSKRLTTYAPGKPIKAADLNKIQDAVIVGHHGLITAQIGIEAAVGHASTNPLIISQNDPSFIWHIPRLIGDRIHRVRIHARDRQAAPITAAVNIFDPTTGIAEFGPQKQTNASGQFQVITLDLGPLTITTRRRVCVHLQASGGPHVFTTMEVQFDRV
jgi:hypothetical protein